MDETKVHKFMGDAREPFERKQNHVLCLSYKEETVTPSNVTVTLLNEDVTCPECIQWIPA